MANTRHTPPQEPEVTCRAVQNKLVQGETANAVVRAHIEDCPPCSELAADQAELAQLFALGSKDAPELQAMFAATQSRIAGDVGPIARIRRWSTTARVGLMLTAAAGLCTVVLLFRARADLAAIPLPGVGLRTCGLMAWVVLGLASAMRPSHLRGLSNRQAWSLLAVAMLGPVWVALLPEMHTGHEASVVQHFALQTALCFAWGTAVAIPVIGLWRVVERRVHPTARHLATAAATAAATANIALLLHCPLTDPAHMAIGHGLIGPIWALALWTFVKVRG
jgi:hypothetical protein